MTAFDAAVPFDAAIPFDGLDVVVPDPSDVRAGVVYDANNLPDPGDVRAGVVYG